jgi:hypothetical protein
MMSVTNISITAKAAAALRRKRSTFKPAPGESFALVWVSSHVDADGQTLAGFTPGYMAGPLFTDQLSEGWALARMPDGTEFYFMPRFTWRADEQYIVDLSRALFSIEPIPRRT